MKHIKKLNNHGSTLLIVIVCIAFISILGSLLFSVSMTNLQMKFVESQSKKNFYSCETVMEKIRTAAQETASIAIEDVYKNVVLINYAKYLKDGEAESNKEIQQEVITRIIESVYEEDLGDDYDTIISNSGYAIVHDDKNYFLDKGYLTTEENDMVKWNESGSVIKCEGTSPYVVRLKDVKIVYDNNEGYSTSIISDIVISIPEFSFTDGTTEATIYQLQQPYQQYALVADGDIVSDNLDGTTNIQGNVYSGAGISINGQNTGNHQVNINGDNIVTRGDITVSDTATLNIGAAPLKPIIWANNLHTYTSDVYSAFGSTLPTKLNINGISIIKDDLTLDGLNSKVTLNMDNGPSGIGGAYIGYTGTHDSLGSSIILNGSGSSLDMSYLNSLILAGRAHVSVQDSILNKDANIMTGESVAFKSNQRAYLMPSKFINVKHNPVTQEDTSPIVDIVYEEDEAIKYNTYLAPIPYKIAAKQTVDTVLRYYYLNFASGRLADSYFKKFYDLYRDDTLNYLAPFALGDVLLPNDPAATIFTVGNIMSHDTVNGISLTSGMSSDITNYPTDADVDDKISDLSLIDTDTVYDNPIFTGKSVSSLEDMYSKVSHLLSHDSTRSYNEEDKTVASTIKLGGIDYIIEQNLDLSAAGMNLFSYSREEDEDTTDPVIFKETDPNKQYFWLINGNVVIDIPDNPASTTEFNGILIATGTITIKDNANVKGLILSTGELGSGDITVGNSVNLNGRLVTTGNISLGQDCTLETNADRELYLDEIFHSEGTILNYIFKNAEMTVDYTYADPVSNMVDLTSMVSYENWKKIE